MISVSSSELIPVDSVHFDNLNKVAQLKMQGSNETEIARATGLKRKDVVALVSEWRETAHADAASRDIARDALHTMNEHYDSLIKATYKTLEQIEQTIVESGASPQRVQQKLAAIKTIGDLEARRLDSLQKAGLLDAQDIGNVVAEMEEKQALLVNILRTKLCDDCKRNVAIELRMVTGKVETVRVE